jgi:hypothetical protein
MIEHHIDIPTADGLMNSFVVYPEENGPFPVILFYMDAPRQTRRVARYGKAFCHCRLLRRVAQSLLPTHHETIT